MKTTLLVIAGIVLFVALLVAMSAAFLLIAVTARVGL